MKKTLQKYLCFLAASLFLLPAMAAQPPYTLPYVESFPNGKFTYSYNYKNDNQTEYYYYYYLTQWLLRTDAAHRGICASSDGDNGYLECYMVDYKCQGRNLQQTITSDMIDLGAAENPVMLFKLYNPVMDTGYDSDKVKVSVREAGTDNWTSVAEGTVNYLCDGNVGAWSEYIECDLQDFKGKVIQWRITVTLDNYKNTLIDDIRVVDVYEKSLEASSISVPSTVRQNTDFDIRVNVFNNGSSLARNYTVVLTDGDGNELKVLKGSPLAPLSKTYYTFHLTYSPFEEAGIRKFGAKVVWLEDEHQEDNVLAPVDVQFIDNILPACTDLAVSANGEGYPRLVWTTPAVSGDNAVTVTESFEDFEPYSFDNQRGWTFLDMDGGPLGGIANATFPNIIGDTTPGSFFVMDAASGNSDESFFAHSGNKYLVSLERRDYGDVNDWAISPLLSGNAQTVTLWSKNRHRPIGYAIQPALSYTKSDNPYSGDYVKVGGTVVETADNGWSKYSFDIPAGSTYFAIQSQFDYSGLILEIDDVTMELDGGAIYNTPRMAGLTCTGYNIYRDGVKINDALVTATTYDDISYIDGDHNYNVTALFDNGREGPVSNTATFTVGVDEVGADTISVSVEGNAIVVASAAGQNVTVNTASGAVVYNGTGDSRVEVAAGIYIVNAGNHVAKVIVK